MALNKAITFVKRAISDKQFRSECYKKGSKQELLQTMGFDEMEFDDVVNMQLVKCQTYEQAEVYQQIGMWFSIL